MCTACRAMPTMRPKIRMLRTWRAPCGICIMKLSTTAMSVASRKHACRDSNSRPRRLSRSSMRAWISESGSPSTLDSAPAPLIARKPSMKLAIPWAATRPTSFRRRSGPARSFTTTRLGTACLGSAAAGSSASTPRSVRCPSLAVLVQTRQVGAIAPTATKLRERSPSTSLRVSTASRNLSPRVVGSTTTRLTTVCIQSGSAAVTVGAIRGPNHMASPFGWFMPP
mmetsp:Transcript_141148/g.450869  ORF Transcript_141148/g.450869 Transcript_141148/m.450869 type:complete len:225 (+) Transcript_141148:747-1421(+)